MASLRFRTDYLHGDMPASRTEYILDRNNRSESRNCTGHSDAVPPTNVSYEYGPLRAYIHNRDLKYTFEIDIEAGIYTAWRVNDYGSPTWMKPRLTARVERSGSTVHCHGETVDTGDRRTVFGYTARRVIIRSTTSRDSELTGESESDGWYIDAPPAWLLLHPPAPPNTYHVLGCSRTNKRDDFTFSRNGEPETGFPILVLRVDKSYFRDHNGILRSHEDSSRKEVTELSETALDPALFKPPRNFQRVMLLPGAGRYPLLNRMRIRLEMLKDSRQLRRLTA